MKKLTAVFYKHPLSISLAVSVVPVVLIVAIGTIFDFNYANFIETMLKSILISFVFGVFLAYPVILTLLNTFFLFGKHASPQKLQAGRKIEVVTILLGGFFSVLYLNMGLIVEITFSDWPETLVNNQLHSPIWTAAMPTIVVIATMGIVGYLVLRFIPLKKLPPLGVVLSISAMYLGVIICVIWTVQLFQKDTAILILCLLPFNLIIIAGKVIKELVLQWNKECEFQEDAEKLSQKPLLLKLNRILSNANHWPWLALLFMLPLFGILLAILVLFGQAPDKVIKAWTETSDWNLSQRVSPQNVLYDEHYLCTVAAGGHKNVVKPIRLGRRHGHEVIVNRQLCIANAFEQILEEKTPKFHRVVRYLYDHCGYPIAKHIHSPYLADMIYFLMKPAEWFFLVVLYLCDLKPENRIALQYLPKPTPETAQQCPMKNHKGVH